MPDIFTKAKRSGVMFLIRSRGNRAKELRMIALFRAHGITGWRQAVFSKPDFLFRREWVALFVDGCFWHGCPCHAAQPGTRAAFWKAKFARNIQRNREVTRTLRGPEGPACVGVRPCKEIALEPRRGTGEPGANYSTRPRRSLLLLLSRSPSRQMR